MVSCKPLGQDECSAKQEARVLTMLSTAVPATVKQEAISTMQRVDLRPVDLQSLEAVSAGVD